MKCEIFLCETCFFIGRLPTHMHFNRDFTTYLLALLSSSPVYGKCRSLSLSLRQTTVPAELNGRRRGSSRDQDLAETMMYVLFAPPVRPFNTHHVPFNGRLLLSVLTTSAAFGPHPSPFSPSCELQTGFYFFSPLTPPPAFSSLFRGSGGRGTIACLNINSSAGPCVARGFSSCWLTAEETERRCSSSSAVERFKGKPDCVHRGRRFLCVLVISSPSRGGCERQAGSVVLLADFTLLIVVMFL